MASIEAQRRKIEFERANSISEYNEKRMPKIKHYGKVCDILGLFLVEDGMWKVLHSCSEFNLPKVLNEFFSDGRYSVLSTEDTHGFTHEEGCFGPTDKINGCYFNGQDMRLALKSKDKKLKGGCETHISALGGGTIHSMNVKDKTNIFNLGYGQITCNGKPCWDELEKIAGKVFYDNTEASIKYMHAVLSH